MNNLSVVDIKYVGINISNNDNIQINMFKFKIAMEEISEQSCQSVKIVTGNYGQIR